MITFICFREEESRKGMMRGTGRKEGRKKVVFEQTLDKCKK